MQTFKLQGVTRNNKTPIQNMPLANSNERIKQSNIAVLSEVSIYMRDNGHDDSDGASEEEFYHTNIRI